VCLVGAQIHWVWGCGGGGRRGARGHVHHAGHDLQLLFEAGWLGQA